VHPRNVLTGNETKRLPSHRLITVLRRRLPAATNACAQRPLYRADSAEREFETGCDRAKRVPARRRFSAHPLPLVPTATGRRATGSSSVRVVPVVRSTRRGRRAVRAEVKRVRSRGGRVGKKSPGWVFPHNRGHFPTAAQERLVLQALWRWARSFATKRSGVRLSFAPLLSHSNPQ
jgi:hypothetical protein